MVLSSKLPMFLWWGQELIQIYNDAYRPSLGINGKHPQAMGQRGKECWPEIWDFIGPLIDKVMHNGESIFYEDLLLPIFRNGRMEDVYWTFSYSPIYGDNGTVEGVHVACVETTEKIVGLKEMVESKSELEFALEAAELGTWDLDPFSYRFSANARLKEWFGVEAHEEIPLAKATAAIAPRDRQPVIDAITRALAAGSDGKYEITYSIIHPKTGVERIVIAKGRAWFDDSGKPYRFNGTLEDITAQRTAEATAVEMRQLSDLATRSVGLGMFKIDYQAGTIDYSPEFAAIMTGNPTLDNLSREAFIRFIHPEDERLRLQALREGLTTGEFHFTPRVIWEDGTVHHVSILAARVGNSPESATFSGIARDVTSIMVQQRALADAEFRLTQERRENEVLFRSIIEQSPIATCLFVGPDMIIMIANDIMLRYWGKDSSVIGMPLAQALPELGDQPFLNILRRVYSTGEAHTETAALARLAVGGKVSDYYFDYTYKPLRTADGEIYGIMNMAIDVTQQAATQRIIDEQTNKLLASFNEAPVAIAVVDGGALTFKMANQFYCTLVGRQPADLIDKPLLEALPELKGQGFDDLLRGVMTTGIPYVATDVPVKIVHNGVDKTVYLDFTYQPQRNSADQVSSVLVVAVEVTNKLLARQEVEASEQKFRSIIMDAPLGMALFHGPDFVMEVANNILISYLGKDPSVIGHPYASIVPELSAQGFIDKMKYVYQTGQSYEETDARLDLPIDGIMQTRYYNYAYTPLFDAFQQVYAIALTAQDVSEQVVARKTLEDAQAALQNAVELAELAVWRFNIQDQTFTYSPRFMDWLGFSEDTVSKNKALARLPEQYRRVVEQAINKAVRPGSLGYYDNEHPIINLVTGQTRIIHASAQVFSDASGNAQYLTGTAQDITKDRMLQKELQFKVEQRTTALREANAELAAVNQVLEASNLELQQFAYIASHDLQEPVRKIAIFTQMLQTHTEGSLTEKAKGYLHKIEVSAGRMTVLINDILAFSRLSNLNDQFVRIDLNEAMAEILAEFDLLIEQKNAVINIGDLPVIEAIPVQMSQLFGNLLSNSLKYANDSVLPRIEIVSHNLSTDQVAEIGLDPSLHYCRIIFSDNGIGFAPEYSEKIFGIFQRLHGKSEYEGTGIGLALCRKIVGNHGGKLTAESKIGHGATFHIILPTNRAMQSTG